MKISRKYWRVARALALFQWGDAEIADHVLEAANGTSYEPDDEDIAGVYENAVGIEPSELPDYVDDGGEEQIVLGEDQAMRIEIVLWNPDAQKDERLRLRVSALDSLSLLAVHELVLSALADATGVVAGQTETVARKTFAQPEVGSNNGEPEQ